MQFADGLYARQMHAPAAKEYEALLRDFPNSALADVMRFRLGECHRLTGNRVAAEKEFRAVFSDYPKSAYRTRAGFRRACIFYDSGLYDSAVDLYQKILAENPTDEIASASMYFLGDSLLKLKKEKDALTVLEKLVDGYAAAEFGAYGLLKLGEVHAARKDYGRALDCFGRAAKAPPTPRVGAEAVFQTARIHFERKEYEESAEAYRRLLKDYPGDERMAAARLQAAWAFHNAGLCAEALEAAAAAGSGNGGSDAAEWLYLRANCERQLMKNAEAAALYKELLDKFPNSAFAGAARYESALVRYRMGDYAAAIEAAAAVRSDPALRKDAYWLLAESNAALKRDAEAVQYYRLIAREFPDSDLADDANYRLGYHLRESGDFAEAARRFRLVAESFPDSPLAPQALFAAGACFARAGQDAEAVQDWSALERAHPDDAALEDALYQKSMSETRLARDADALVSLAKLLKRFPGSRFAADARYWRGLLIMKQGRPAEAEKELRAALQAAPRDDLAPLIRYRLALALQATDRDAEAADLLEGLLKTAFASELPPELMRWLAEYRHDQKKYDAALAAARSLIARDRTAAWQEAGWCLAGRAMLAKGDAKGAGEAYRAALAADGRTGFGAEAALRLGEGELSAGNAAAAAGYFQKAAAAGGPDADPAVRARAYAGLARAARDAGDDPVAARYFMSVAVLYDEDQLVPECLYEAAAAFLRAGQAGDGRKAIAELRERFPGSEWAVRAARLPGAAEAPPAAPEEGGGT